MLAIFYVILNWNTFTAPFERDEGEYAYSAWVLLQGQLPYLHTFLHKPPLTIFMYLLGYFVSPGAVWPVRVIGALFLLGTAYLLGQCAKKLYGRGAGFMAPWLFVALMATPGVFPYAANTEKFMLLPLVGTLALYIYNETETARKQWFAAGFLSALALLFKPICLFVLVFLHGLWAYDIWRKNRAELWRHAALVLAGGLAATALCCGFIVIGGAWGPFWELNVKFNGQLAKLFGNDLTPLKEHLRDFSKYWWLTVLCAAGFFVRPTAKKLLMGGLFACAFAAAYRDINGHYYILLLPFLALLAAGFMNTLKTKYAALLCVAAVAANIAPMAGQLSLTPEQLVRKIYGGNPFSESVLMAKKLAKITTPDDEVFIAGSEPQILYYAKRKSASRFVIMYPLMYATPLARKYQELAIDELTAKQPKAVVLSRTGASWAGGDKTPPIFMAFFNNFILKYDFVGGYVTENNQIVWKAGKENEQNVLLALYTLKH